MIKMSFMLAVALCSCVGVSATQAKTRYSVTDLSALAPADPYPQWLSINNAGDLAGIVGGNAVTYINGQLTAYENLGHVVRPVLGNTGILTFNAAREFDVYHGYVAANGVATRLTGLSTLHGETYVTAGNAAGTFVGGADNDIDWCTGSGTCAYQTRAVMYQNGIPTELGVLPGHTHSMATAINSRGTIVGRSGDSNWGGSSFIYENGTMRDLNVGAANLDTEARAINDAGQVAGTTWNNVQGWQSWIYRNGHVEHFGEEYADTEVVDLNNAGQMIGDSWDGGPYRGWIREDGEITLLDDLLHDDRWKVTLVHDLNDKGQIVAQMRRPDGTIGFAVLTPDEPPILLPVPEPGTYAMLVGGLGVLALCRRRLVRDNA